MSFRVSRTVGAVAAMAFMAVLSPNPAWGAGIPGVQLEEVVVHGKRRILMGTADSASVGTIVSEQIEHRTLLRPAEILETIPGMVVTQHSGAGKANQYFLRGFNLDHGTDFANWIDGMPVNMVTHGHGHGYSDFNFLIPELVDNIRYHKGVYYAEDGDFSTAGTARVSYANEIDRVLKVTAGEHNYLRGLATGGFDIGQNKMVFGLEYMEYDGPWDLPQDFTRTNGMARYVFGDDFKGGNIQAMFYEADWVATDQIPQRLVDSGEIGRFGFVDDGSGGDTHRYSLSGNLHGELGPANYTANTYVMDYQLRLTSNPTYFVDDLVNGDEFTQFDDRTIWGGNFDINGEFSPATQYSGGVVLRYDDIGNVGVGPSSKGELRGISLQDSVKNTHAGAWASLGHDWTSYLNTTVGLRYDYFNYDVTDVGSRSDGKVSPKISVRLGPWEGTELFLNWGQGFRSNEGRGVTDPVTALDPIVDTEGREIGLRSGFFNNMQISVAYFEIDLGSELVFVGDNGSVEPRGASERKGIEVGIFYQPREWLTIDGDYAHTTARFKEDPDGIGNIVPDSMEDVFSLSLAIDTDDNWFGGARARYFGPRALLEDNSLRSDSTFTINANAGYRFTEKMSFRAEVINIFDAENDDITYWFESRTADELAAGLDPIEDLHFHPVEPRMFRLTLEYRL